jgi:hypothetical protein
MLSLIQIKELYVHTARRNRHGQSNYISNSVVVEYNGEVDKR